MKQASNSEEVHPIPLMNCQSRADHFPFDTKPSYIPVCKPGTPYYTFAKRCKVWVTLPGQEQGIKIMPESRQDTRTQATSFMLHRVQQQSDPAAIVFLPTVRIPVAPGYGNGQRLRVYQPKFVQDKTLSTQSRSIFPKPGTNHRQKRVAARANKRARAAAAEAEDGGASSGGEGDVNDDENKGRKVRGVDAGVGRVDESEPQEGAIRPGAP